MASIAMEGPEGSQAKDTGSGWDIGFEDDELSAGASAAAAAAPLLSGAPALAEQQDGDVERIRKPNLLGTCSSFLYSVDHNYIQVFRFI